MKRLLLILILTFSFQSLSKADDIRDFEIEGISIGDNLFDHLTKKKFKKWEEHRHYYKNGNFIKTPCIYPSKQYDSVHCTYKKAKNGKLKIYGVNGSIKFENNISACFSKKDEIVNEFKSVLKNITINDYGTYKHDYDKTGNSKQTVVDFNFSDGGYIRVACNNWSNKITTENNWIDGLIVNTTSKELENFINNKTYN